jgi:pilus assembly protein Flp/PilA
MIHITIKAKRASSNQSGKERVMKKLRNFFKDESGASAVEYCLLVSLIAVVIVTAVNNLGTNLSSKFHQVATAIGS